MSLKIVVAVYMIEKILSQKTGALFVFTMLYAKSHELLEHD